MAKWHKCQMPLEEFESLNLLVNQDRLLLACAFSLFHHGNAAIRPASFKTRVSRSRVKIKIRAVGTRSPEDRFGMIDMVYLKFKSEEDAIMFRMSI